MHCLLETQNPSGWCSLNGWREWRVALTTSLPTSGDHLIFDAHDRFACISLNFRANCVPLSMIGGFFNLPHDCVHPLFLFWFTIWVNFGHVILTYDFDRGSF